MVQSFPIYNNVRPSPRVLVHRERALNLGEGKKIFKIFSNKVKFSEIDVDNY